MFQEQGALLNSKPRYDRLKRESRLVAIARVNNRYAYTTVELPPHSHESGLPWAISGPSPERHFQPSRPPLPSDRTQSAVLAKSLPLHGQVRDEQPRLYMPVLNISRPKLIRTWLMPPDARASRAARTGHPASPPVTCPSRSLRGLPSSTAGSSTPDRARVPPRRPRAPCPSAHAC